MTTTQEFKNNIFSEETIKEIVSLANSVFYNFGNSGDYDEITNRIKGELKPTFHQFFDRKHHNYIDDKIDKTQIVFVYTILGLKNSIEEFIFTSRKNHFRNSTGMLLEYPHSFKAVSNTIKRMPDSINSRIVNDSYFKDCCKALGLNQDDIINNPTIRQEFIDKVHYYADIWNKETYSDNPEINIKIKKLASYVKEYRDKMTEYYASQGLNQLQIKNKLQNATRESPIGEDIDPVYDYLLRDIKDNSLRTEIDSRILTVSSRCPAFQAYRNSTGLSYTAFGIHPNDRVILHEMIHSVDNGGFERGFKSIRTNTDEIPNQTLRTYEAWNEVTTEFLAKQMTDWRNQTNQPTIVNPQVIKSKYSIVFDIMGEFLTKHISEINDARLEYYPASCIQGVIGYDEFEDIATYCNNILTLYNDRSNPLSQIFYEKNRVDLQATLKDLEKKSEYPSLLSRFNSILRGETDSSKSKDPNNGVAKAAKSSRSTRTILDNLNKMSKFSSSFNIDEDSPEMGDED